MPLVTAAMLPFTLTAASAGATAAAGIYGAHAQGKASRQAVDAQSRAADRAAELEAKSAADTLAFTREQEATRKAEFDKTQALNKAQYDQDFNLGIERYNTRRNDLASYRTLGGMGVQGLQQGLGNGNGQQYLPPPRQLVKRSLGGM